MPYYKKVPLTHRVRRFQLGKLAIMLKDIKDEENAVLRRAEGFQKPKLTLLKSHYLQLRILRNTTPQLLQAKWETIMRTRMVIPLRPVPWQKDCLLET
eukprot:2352926-Amphidinium_carterae.1